MKFGMFSGGVFPTPAYRMITKEGQEVKLWLDVEDLHNGPSEQAILLTLPGLVPREKDWKKVISWADLVVADMGSYEKEIEDVKKTKKPWVGSNPLFVRLEEDRVFAYQVFKRTGLLVPSGYSFRDLRTAISFIKKNPSRWVVKQNGQSERSLNYVGKEENGNDAREMLEHYEEEIKTKKGKERWDPKFKGSVTLQRRIEGVEVAIGAFWDGERFSGHNINFEHKRQYPGNVGVATDEQGTVLSPISKDHPLVKKSIEKLIPLLKREPYHTYCDLNMIVNRQGCFILEGTFRFGWPLVELQTECQEMPWSELLVKLATGKLEHIPMKKGFTIGVVVSAPGYPYFEAANEKGRNIPILDIPDMEHFHPHQLYMKNKRFYTTGAYGQSFVVTANSHSLDRARKLVYERISAITAPNHGYRNDIGGKVEESLNTLEDLGYGI